MADVDGVIDGRLLAKGWIGWIVKMVPISCSDLEPVLDSPEKLRSVEQLYPLPMAPRFQCILLEMPTNIFNEIID